MAIDGLDHYNLRGSRTVIDELRSFYVDVVGLQPGFRPPFKSAGYWLYANDRPILHLTVAADGECRPPNVTSTFDHVAFACTDLAKFQTVLRERNIQYTDDRIPGTGQRQIFFADPAGNGVELNFAADAV
jgi:catechol-2,3-dioxygenase